MLFRSSDAAGHRPAPDHVRRRAQVLQPPVGARSDEDRVDWNVPDRRARLQVHVGQRAFGCLPRGGRESGGWLGDHIGRRRVVVWSHVLLFPFLLAFLSASSAGLALALLVPIGVTLYAPFSVMTVMGQEYVPSRVATASGFIIGVAVTLGGLVAPLLGRVADLHGVHAALSTLLFVPLAGALLAATLPRELPRV